MKELQRRGDPNVVIALAGNKCDLEAKRKVQQEEVRAQQQQPQQQQLLDLYHTDSLTHSHLLAGAAIRPR